MHQQHESSTLKISPESRPPATAVWGTIYGAVSAVAYTAANIGLRSVADCDAVFVSCIKALPTVIGVSPWLIARAWRGQVVFPPTKIIMYLVAAGLFGQLAGNVMFQSSLGVIGMALTVPLCMGAIIIGSALLGRMFLHEPISVRTLAALAALIAAIWVLSIGARGASAAVALIDASNSWLVMAGVAGACLAGIAYAVLGFTIRVAVIGKSTVAATTFTIASVGLTSLGVFSLARLGPAGIAATDPSDLSIMFAAGCCNLIAFVSLTRALQITTLVYVNALNASQVAMASLAGIVLFSERPSSALLLGVGLTIGGLLLMPRGE